MVVKILTDEGQVKGWRVGQQRESRVMANVCMLLCGTILQIPPLLMGRKTAKIYQGVRNGERRF